jgi:RNA polymerase sigma-70 factor, ECF subfamily
MQRAFALDPIDPGHDPVAAPPEGAASIPGRSAGKRPAPLDRAGVRPTGPEAAGLYEAYAARVRGYISFRVRDPDDADDMTAEVFRRVVAGPAPVETAARPAWIFRVAHNVIVDHYRRRRLPLVPSGVLDRPDDAPSLPDRLVRDEQLRATDRALRGLPGSQRAAIYLRFYEDLPYDQIASILGMPAATVRSHVFRGLKRLAGALGEEA